jgi:hypothetical protein
MDRIFTGDRKAEMRLIDASRFTLHASEILHKNRNSTSGYEVGGSSIQNRVCTNDSATRLDSSSVACLTKKSQVAFS